MKSTTEVFYALNRNNHTAVVLDGFSCWEHVQGAFRCGIVMPDGHNATGIGRCGSLAHFKSRANFGEWSVLTRPVVKNPCGYCGEIHDTPGICEKYDTLYNR